MTQRNMIPEYIDLEKWRDQGYHWQGEFTLTDFQRLAESVNKLLDGNVDDTQTSTQAPTLQFDIKRKGGVTWFSIELNAVVEMSCQRCLSPIPFVMPDSITLALLDDETQASLLSEDDDWILIEEVAERMGSELRLPILSVIEDELLLQIPASFKHEINDENCVPVDFIEEEDDIEIQENPFGALVGLKQQLKDAE